ncbi:hypothetical protein K2X05_04545, partial [bacterium]|nr:hypothetical protein [bacterium]
MIHVLDEAKTIFTLTQTNSLDYESCDYRVKKITRILREGSQIYLVGAGDFREPRTTGLRKYNFPNIGTVEDNGRSLQLIAVKNEHGQCFGAFTEEKQPCPPAPFP